MDLNSLLLALAKVSLSFSISPTSHNEWNGADVYFRTYR